LSFTGFVSDVSLAGLSLRELLSDVPDWFLDSAVLEETSGVDG